MWPLALTKHPIEKWSHFNQSAFSSRFECQIVDCWFVAKDASEASAKVRFPNTPPSDFGEAKNQVLLAKIQREKIRRIFGRRLKFLLTMTMHMTFWPFSCLHVFEKERDPTPLWMFFFTHCCLQHLVTYVLKSCFKTK